MEISNIEHRISNVEVLFGQPLSHRERVGVRRSGLIVMALLCDTWMELEVHFRGHVAIACCLSEAVLLFPAKGGAQFRSESISPKAKSC